MKTIWNKDMDFMLLYLREYLKCSFNECLYHFNREFPDLSFSRGSIAGRIRRLRNNGVTYEPQPCELV